MRGCPEKLALPRCKVDMGGLVELPMARVRPPLLPGARLRQFLHGSSDVYRSEHCDYRCSRHSDGRHYLRDLGVPVEKTLELLRGLPFVNDHEFTVSRDKSVVDYARALRGRRNQ